MTPTSLPRSSTITPNNNSSSGFFLPDRLECFFFIEINHPEESNHTNNHFFYANTRALCLWVALHLSIVLMKKNTLPLVPARLGILVKFAPNVNFGCSPTDEHEAHLISNFGPRRANTFFVCGREEGSTPPKRFK